MKLYESALFQLALLGKITLEEAKILKSLHTNRACSFGALLLDTGLCKEELRYALSSLREHGIVFEAGGFYFVPDFEGAIARLIGNKECVAQEAVIIR